jgi:amino acid transporter
MQAFTNPLTTFGDAGTLAAFGFLLAYFLVSFASLAYLRRRGEVRPKNIAAFSAAIVCLLVPTVGSFYPVPAAPVRYFPYYFLAYLLVGAAWLVTVSRRNPGVLGEIEADLEATVDVHDPKPLEEAK